MEPQGSDFMMKAQKNKKNPRAGSKGSHLVRVSFQKSDPKNFRFTRELAINALSIFE